MRFSIPPHEIITEFYQTIKLGCEFIFVFNVRQYLVTGLGQYQTGSIGWCYYFLQSQIPVMSGH